jgi:predicted HAD superfamily Cof-like phosphohydrolase
VKSLLSWIRQLLSGMPQAKSPHFPEHRNAIAALDEAMVNMFDPVADVEEFHKKFGLEYTGKPRHLMGELGEFREKFLREEVEEYASIRAELGSRRDPTDSEITHGLALQLDALVDEVYVAIGNAYLQGFDFREAWRRVHAANMKKVRAERAEDSKRGTKFDVVKPPGWEAPSHLDLVADHAHKEKSK